jgi:hypothetical protein
MNLATRRFSASRGWAARDYLRRDGEPLASPVLVRGSRVPNEPNRAAHLPFWTPRGQADTAGQPPREGQAQARPAVPRLQGR